jgi:hypothetical protein
LDRLITLHQRKYDKLSKIKKSMLEITNDVSFVQMELF